MKKIWRKLRKKCTDFWNDDVFDTNKQHLSQHDKRSLLYGGFILSISTVSICLFMTGISNMRISNQNNKDMQEMIKIICTYLATATEDEYDDIAQTIRHDLIYCQYGKDIEDIIKYIPNTADGCCLEREEYTERVNLVFLNTGEIYGLDIFDKSISPEDQQKNNRTIINSGYDEVSETYVMVIKNPNMNNGTASIDRGRGIVSVHKMKTHFCDNCIREILNITKNEFVGETVIYDAVEKKFYPVKEGELQIGDYSLYTFFEDTSYKIEIKYSDN